MPALDGLKTVASGIDLKVLHHLKMHDKVFMQIAEVVFQLLLLAIKEGAPSPD